MPEGPLLHYLQRRHQAALVGQRLAVDSPQGPFAAGARQLHGRRLEAVQAHGKRLFYRFEGGGVLHVHLGLFGHFHEAAPQAPPRESCRARLVGEALALHLAGPMVCEVLSLPEAEAVRATLGPDPLRPEATRQQGCAALAAFRGPIGLALMEQRCVAGVGNILRAEALFLAGLHPALPAATLPAAAHARLWQVLVRMMRASVRTGTLRTVLPADARRLGLPGAVVRHGHEASYVYGRAGQPCYVCGSPVDCWAMGGRTVWACPRCQPPA